MHAEPLSPFAELAMTGYNNNLDPKDMEADGTVNKNPKKNVLEVKLSTLEGVAVQDGGLSAWLVVLAAFWIFFMMVI